MRASIVLLISAGCGVFGGGKSLEGRWEGTCEAEDDDGNNYDYDMELDLQDEGSGVAEGDGAFDSSIVLLFVTTPYYQQYFEEELSLEGEGDIRGEFDEGEWTLEGSDWRLRIDGDELDELDSGDWELVGTRDGDSFTGEFELDLAGEITVRGECDLDLT